MEQVGRIGLLQTFSAYREPVSNPNNGATDQISGLSEPRKALQGRDAST